jgi:multiple antibiotic resistance protein
MEDANTLPMQFVLIISIVLIMFVTYLILFSSSKLIKLHGQTGINVMMRIMGLIVMVIAVEFFFSGLRPIILDILKDT